MIAIISHPDCLLHNATLSHIECPDRIRVIANALQQSELNTWLQYIEAPLVTDEQLLRVHTQEYIHDLLNRSPKEKEIYLDPDTVLGVHTLLAARRAAGAVVKAVDMVMTNEIDQVFCNIRPPGHHAEHNRAMGFCFFNNIAVGVAHALQIYKVKRIAILDFDAHRGNGTEDIFYKNQKVLIYSIYEEHLYPFNAPLTAPNIIHVPLSSGTASQEFRMEIMQYGLDKINAFKPQLIFISAGFDGYQQDTISNLYLTELDYFWITQQIKSIAIKHCDNRIISVLEGGYALEGLGKCVLAHLRGLLEFG